MPESRFQPADILGAVAAAPWWRELVRKSAECRDSLHGDFEHTSRSSPSTFFCFLASIDVVNIIINVSIKRN